MSMSSFVPYLLVMALSTYLIRAIPFALITKKLENPFIRSFLHYIPYTVLTVMTIPGALYATGNPVAAACGLVAAVIAAVKGKGLTFVAFLSCLTVLIVEVMMHGFAG